jgi:succinate dehydrogenase / fumarate reductase cytochrome b subunit
VYRQRPARQRERGDVPGPVVLLKGTWMNMLLRPVQSSLGSKYLMAVTGIILTTFVLGHLAGNLLIFAPNDALNSYAATLKHNPALLWTARIILLVSFVLHIAVGIRLAYSNKEARPVRYFYEDTVQASWASRHMILTGLLLLAFVLYHLAHFTFGWVMAGAYDPHDVRAMVIAGFRNPLVTLSYLVAMVFLWLHLWHGVTSLFQSLGICQVKYNRLIKNLGPTISTLVLIGNCLIPLSIWLGLVK